MQILHLISGIALVLFGASILRLGLRILTASDTAFAAAHAASRQTRSSPSAETSGSVRHGMAVDLHTGSLISQGRVADEIVRAVVG
jgi:hypothetical protein